MSTQKFLYEDFNAYRKGGFIKPVPKFVEENLRHELRPYQRAALENFINYLENEELRRRPTQTLFHMATGSGKTLIMAALIIWLYRLGYRNYLFFVHRNTILDKTRDNFLERASGKYLFADVISIDGERVPVREVSNFDDADEQSINIHFTTIQQLSNLFTTVRENAMTVDDLTAHKLVLISDEAHHLNADRKRGRRLDDAQSWEQTVKYIFDWNEDNILLEFTATCDLDNPAIRAAYVDKIIFDYPLTKYYRDGYSKDIMAFKSDAELEDRELAACVMSQYRLKVFAEHRLNVKPVILFKSQRIADSQRNMEAFIEMMRTLTGERLSRTFELSSDILERARRYFDRCGLTLDDLALELRAEFDGERCLSANDEKAAADVLNTLEQSDNRYRAVFAVDKLDEGWDVLNLFDIVRLYETRQSGGKKISPTTISEAQLIGRGARYYPFALEGIQSEYRRKFDGDLDNEMRVCEVLYYHCQNDRRYITELRQALREIGLELDETRELHYRLRDDFKRESLYRGGSVLTNVRLKDDETDFRAKFESARKVIYKFEDTSGSTSEESLVDGGALKLEALSAVSAERSRRTLGELASKNYSAVHRALRRFPIFRFDRLRLKFDGLSSTREFITSAAYLGDVPIDITVRTLNGRTMYRAAFSVFKNIARVLETAEVLYKGSREFRAAPFREIFGDKTIRVSKDTALEQIELGESDDWFAYGECWGTSEEREFVEYMRQRIGELRAAYDEVRVVRNERALKVYDFDEGRRFEPDYVIFLRRDGAEARVQVFVEPKGGHLLEHDAWKEKFLRELESVEGGRVIGLPFFNNEVERKKIFDDAFRRLMELR